MGLPVDWTCEIVPECVRVQNRPELSAWARPEQLTGDDLGPLAEHTKAEVGPFSHSPITPRNHAISLEPPRNMATAGEGPEAQMWAQHLTPDWNPTDILKHAVLIDSIHELEGGKGEQET